MTTEETCIEERPHTGAEKVASPLSRRMFVGAAALASAGFLGASALGQNRSEQKAGRIPPSSAIRDLKTSHCSKKTQTPTSTFTDHGNPGPVWFSFDLAPKRMQGGRLDTSGDATGAAAFQRYRGREHAPHCRVLSRTSLAHRG